MISRFQSRSAWTAVGGLWGWRSSIRGLLFGLCTALLTPSVGRAQVIFVSPCGIEIPQGQVGILRVWVCLENAIRDGINGAEFRITGLPPGWVTSISASAPAALIGDPFGSGVSVHSSCLTSAGQYLELFAVALFATTAETDVLLAVAALDPPLPAPFDCP